MTTTTKEAPHPASYAAMRERVDAKIAEEVRAGAEHLAKAIDRSAHRRPS